MKKLITLMFFCASLASAQTLSPFYKTAAASSPVTVLDSTGATGGYGGDFSFSHTVSAGSNRLLLVIFGISQDVYIDSVKYASVSMSLANGSDSTGSEAINAWYLVNPTSGTNTVDIYTTGSAHRGAVALTLGNVDQATPLENGAEGPEQSMPTRRDSVTVTTTAGKIIIGAGTLAGEAAPAIDDVTGDAFWSMATSNSTTAFGMRLARFTANDASATLKMYGTGINAWMGIYAVQVRAAP